MEKIVIEEMNAMKEITVAKNETEIEIKAKCIMEEMIERDMEAYESIVSYETQTVKIRYIAKDGTKRVKTLSFADVHQLITLF